MSNVPKTPPAPDQGPEAMRRYLADAAVRELDTLRARLDTRLAALETALAHPERYASIDTLVVELARVATAEAEAAARRAAVEAQAQAQRSVESDRAAATAVRSELDQARAALRHERDAAGGIRQELSTVRGALEEARAASAAIPALRAELDQARAALRQERDAAGGMQQELGTVRGALDEARAASAAVPALRAELDQARAALQSQESIVDLSADLERANRQLESERAANRQAAQQFEDRIAALELELLGAQPAPPGDPGASHAAALQAMARERNDLAAELDAARQAASAMQAAFDARVKAQETERTRLEHARQEGDKRAGDIQRERDALAAELDSVRQAARAAQSAVEVERLHAAQARQDAETRAAAQLASDRAAREAAHATALTAQQQAAETLARELKLERERADRARVETEARLAQLLDERDGLARDLETVRRAVVDLKTGADERLDGVAAERARIETAWKDAEARAQQAADRLAAGLEEAKAQADRTQRDAEARLAQALKERDALARDLETARQAAVDVKSTADERLVTADAERARVDRALKDAEARAQQAVRDRESVTAELERAKQAVVAARDAVASELQTLEAERDAAEARAQAALAHIETLEAQGADTDEELDLSALLDHPAAAEVTLAASPARRYPMAGAVKARIARETGVLVDLSIAGAQVKWSSELEVNQPVTIVLASDDAPVTCAGSVVWSWLDPNATDKSLGYRAGIVFLDPDEAAIETVIIQYAAS